MRAGRRGLLGCALCVQVLSLVRVQSSMDGIGMRPFRSPVHGFLPPWSMWPVV